MHTSKEKYDHTMNEVRAAKTDDIPTESEVDAVEKEANNLSEERPHKSHLTSDEKNLLGNLVKSFSENKITDPVLLQLLKMREASKQSYIEKQRSMKTLYVGIMKELNDLSQETIKLQGALENTERQIIEFLMTQKLNGAHPPS